jgi:hypothetical protein
MGISIQQLNSNVKTNFTDAVANGGKPSDCFMNVLKTANLDNSTFLSQPFSLPILDAVAKLPKTQQTNGFLFALLVTKLSAIDGIIDIDKIALDKAKTFKDCVALTNAYLKDVDAEIDEDKDVKVMNFSTNAKIGLGVGAVLASMLGYAMLKKD